MEEEAGTRGREKAYSKSHDSQGLCHLNLADVLFEASYIVTTVNKTSVFDFALSPWFYSSKRCSEATVKSSEISFWLWKDLFFCYNLFFLLRDEINESGKTGRINLILLVCLEALSKPGTQHAFCCNVPSTESISSRTPLSSVSLHLVACLWRTLWDCCNVVHNRCSINTGFKNAHALIEPSNDSTSLSPRLKCYILPNLLATSSWVTARKSNLSVPSLIKHWRWLVV